MISTYTTIQGDMFDWISYRIYGHEKYANVLMRENPLYSSVVIFDAGIILVIPNISSPASNVSSVPWGTLFNK